MMPRKAPGRSGFRGQNPLRPGDEVILRTDVPHRLGAYRCQVLDIGNTQLRLTAPMRDGWVVLIPVGTPVELETPDGTRLKSRVVDRVTGPGRCLVIEQPVPLPARNLERAAPLVVISSGKGGVGKSCLAVNLAVLCAQAGRRVLLMDLDLGTGNLDVLLGIGSAPDLSSVVRGERGLREVVVEPLPGLQVLLAGSGAREVAELTSLQYDWLASELQALGEATDLMIGDVSSGVSERVTSTLAAASHPVVVTTPEPHAITDAYALLKVYRERHGARPFHLVVNMARSRGEGERVAAKMQFAAERFLGLELRLAGVVPLDAAMLEAVRLQRPVATRRPQAPVVQALGSVGRALLGPEDVQPPSPRWA
ncbi:MAG TPA: P-loop NTPase, partial [Limnochorda sp.]